MVATSMSWPRMVTWVWVSVPSRGFDGCNCKTITAPYVSAVFQSPRGDSMVATPVTITGVIFPANRFSPLAGIRWLQLRRGRQRHADLDGDGFSPLAGIRWLQPTIMQDITIAVVDEFQSPRGDSMVATYILRYNFDETDRSFSPLAGIRWLQLLAQVMQAGEVAMFQSPRGDSMVATLRRRHNGTVSGAVSVPSRGFDGCNRLASGLVRSVAAAGFQSPRGDSMVATWCASTRSLMPRAPSSVVSVPSRGFDGCNRIGRGSFSATFSKKFQSPRGDSMVATRRGHPHSSSPDQGFSPLAGIRWLQR